MLKKFLSSRENDHPFSVGVSIYLVTREGTIVEGFSVANTLGDLVSLDRSPMEGSEKQGFTIEGNRLRPNWCAGKRRFEAGCVSRKEAEELSKKIQEEAKLGKKELPEPCTSKKNRN